MLIEYGIKNPSHTNYAKFIESSLEFFPEIKNAQHIGSMFTVRAVPPRVEDTDERLTLVKKLSLHSQVRLLPVCKRQMK